MKHHTLAPDYSLHPDGYVLVPLRGKHGKGKHAKIDLSDYVEASRWRWYVNHHGYAYGQRQTPDRIRLQVFLHHLVMPTPEDQVCDHINGDRLDARRENLRVASYSVNNRNRTARDSEAGFKGVQRVQNGRWAPRIKWRDRNWYLGAFATEQQAAHVYDSAALFITPELGDHALNFPERREPVSPVELRRRAHASGDLRQNSSPFIGVHWKVRNDAFQAYCVVGGVTVYLGLHATEEQAARAHDSYALLHKPKAELNFDDGAPRTKEEILAGSPRRQRPTERSGRRRGESGYLGVRDAGDAYKKRWNARISLGGRRLSLGYFETPEAAAEAYDAACRQAGLPPVNFP